VLEVPTTIPYTDSMKNKNTMTSGTKIAIKFGAFIGGLIGLITGLLITLLFLIVG
jgi:hypothetical protein